MFTFEEAVGPETAAELAAVAKSLELWEAFVALPKKFINDAQKVGIVSIETIVSLWDAIMSGGYAFRDNQIADRQFATLLYGWEG